MARVIRVRDQVSYLEQLGHNDALKWTAAEICQAGKEKLLTMQYRLGLGGQWGRLEFPKAFLPLGQAQFDSSRIHEIAQFLPQGISPDGSDANRAWLEVLRFVVARLTLFGTIRSRIVNYSTCKGDLSHLKQIAKVILQRPVEEGYFWSRVDGPSVEGKSSSSRTLITLVSHYHLMGALPDAFRMRENVVSDEPERDRSGEPEYEYAVEINRKWQPLPMEFVAQVGWRSLKIIKSIAPTLLDALDAALEIPKAETGANGGAITKERARERTLEARDAIISEWAWKDERGEPLLDMGFVPARLNNKQGPISWPPKTCAQALEFAHQLVKPAHLWMVLLGNGPRNSDAVSMRDDCLVEMPNGNYRWEGRTYKMTGIPGGRETDAVVPEIIVQAISQQARLAGLMKRERGFTGNALWIGALTEEVKNLTILLNGYVDVLGLRELLGEDNPSCHEHRFRKTLAKIVALALTNAIMILKDCFGHTDAVMTLLSYILADPSIAQEVIKVQKELTIMMAVDVITNRETVAGPGASALRQRADQYLTRVGKSAFEPQDAYEFARRETFDGRSWMMIAPGVLCTAPHDVTQVSTPCALGQGRHNPANCKTGCDWQILLTGYYVTQADDSVTYALKELQRAVDQEDEAMVAFWAGQAKAWLYRYDEVAEKWKDHDLVKRYVSRPTQIMLAAA